MEDERHRIGLLQYNLSTSRSVRDPYLSLMDRDPTPFFSDFKDVKKKLFHIFFLKIYPQAHHLQSSKFFFLLKFCAKILFCKHYFSLLNTFMRKRKDPEPDTDPYLPLTNGSGCSVAGIDSPHPIPPIPPSHPPHPHRIYP